MFRRLYKPGMLLLAAAVLLSCSSSTMSLSDMGAKGLQLSYKPPSGSATRYQVSSNSEVTQNMMGQEQSFGETADMQLKLTVTSSDESAVKYSVVHETMNIESNAPGGGGRDDYKKAVLESDINIETSPSGKVEKISGVDEIKKSTPGKNIELSMQSLFLVFPKKSIKIGGTWPEEETNTVYSGPLKIEIKSSTVYRFVGVEKHKNRECFRFDSQSTATLIGAGEQSGMDLEYSGSSTGKGTVYFDYLNGVIVSVTGSSTSDGIVSVPSQGFDIPTSVVQSSSLDLIE